jgi:L-ascorbate metabolism protein UlaG (beta-lactamase superfamily)
MGIRLTFYGHATLGIETSRYQILVDPYFKGNEAFEATKLNIDQLKVDFILVTHGHGDHVGDTIKIAGRTGARVICNSEIGDWLENQGVKTRALQNGGKWRFPFGQVKMTFALHGSGLPEGVCGGLAAGFIITFNSGKKFYCAGDTGLFGDMTLIGEDGIDLALIPIGGLYTMDPDDALRAVKLIHPKVVIPIHYNTFNHIRQDAGKWKVQVENETQSKVIILQPGEIYESN